MPKYNGSPETVHFANWVLHSGCVDPVQLAKDAIDRATAAYWGDKGCDDMFEASGKFYPTGAPEEKKWIENDIRDAALSILGGVLRSMLDTSYVSRIDCRQSAKVVLRNAVAEAI